MSDIEGKVTRVGARERGQQTSFKLKPKPPPKLIRNLPLPHPSGCPSMSSIPMNSIAQDLPWRAVA